MLRAIKNEPINLNSSFEEPDTTGNELVTAEHWDAKISRYGKFGRKEEKPHTGDASIYLHEFWSGNINQTVDVKPGLIIAQLKYYVTTVVTKLLGTVWLDLEYLDKDGNVLSSIRTAQQPFVNSLGRWETIGVMDQIPARVGGEPVTQVRMSATINGFQEGGIMYLDDFGLFQADDAFNVPFIK
ncbi:MAG: hypothetical protein GX815_10580 [Clostridiales bacterium]|nr:hypothetical protein [Clostridiales bacterium]